MAGLTSDRHSFNSNAPNFNNMEWAIRCDSNQKLYVYENGVYQKEVGTYTSANGMGNGGDLITLRVTSPDGSGIDQTDVEWLRNDDLLYKKEYKKNDPSTWSPINPHRPRFPLYFDTNIHVVGAGLVDAEICTVA